jgi:E3 ubiquitin-protein ligase TRIP12
VLHTIETIAERKLSTAKSKEKEKEMEVEPLPQPFPPILTGEIDDGLPLPPPPVFVSTPATSAKKSSSTPVDPQDLIILRARVVRFRYLIGQAEVEEDTALQALRRLCLSVTDSNVDLSTLREGLLQIVNVLWGSADNISSFELKQSGLIDTLLTVVTEGDFNGSLVTLRSALPLNRSEIVDLNHRRKVFFEAFFTGGRSLPVLVKRLQEILTRSENFEVRTVSPGFEGNVLRDKM